MANEGKDGMREMLEKLEKPEVRWALVVIGVVILLRLRLILFAAALPVMAYWHYSNQSEEPTADQDAAEEPGAGEGEDDLMDLDGEEPPTFQSVGRAIPSTEGLGLNDEEGDPYDQSFWDKEDSANGAPRKGGNAGAAAKASAPRTANPWREDSDDDLLRPGGHKPSTGVSKPKPMGGGLVKANDFDFLAGEEGDVGKTDFDFGFGGNDDKPMGGGLVSANDFDFLGGNDDMDFGGFGKGKGKGKGKGVGKGDKSSGGKGFDGPRPGEPNPKQIFVAGIGDTNEDEIKIFFEDVGEVDRLKVLKQPDGQSKGVCFVTFRTEEQAQKALGMHGCDFQGRTLTVRLAHGGSKGKGDEKGGGGFGGGGGGFGGIDRPSGSFGADRGARSGDDRGGGDRFARPADLGGQERFGAAFGDTGGGFRAGGKGGGGGGGKGGNRRNERGEMDDLLEEALAEVEGPLKVNDFDFAARRFLSELKARDRTDGTQRLQEALDMVFKYTSSKDRSSVRKWPAYIFTLLQKFDPNLMEELRGRDAERRRDKGGGRGDEPSQEESIRARQFAPPSDTGHKQVLDRWGKPVLL